MVKAIVGANWGDEGKGKITDMLAEESDIIVRFQGGDRKSVVQGKSVDLGGRRIIKKQKSVE